VSRDLNNEKEALRGKSGKRIFWAEKTGNTRALLKK